LKIAEKRDDGATILDRMDVSQFMRTCEDCGQHKECRPYGRGGAWVCFQCGMKDEAEAARQFAKATNI